MEEKTPGVPTPEQPESPATPPAPKAPESPAAPAKPEQPSTPAEPATPPQPAAPDEAEAPAAPAAPAAPVAPAAPEAPAAPVAPESPAAPAAPATPAAPQSPMQPEPVRPMGAPAQPSQSNQPQQPQQPVPAQPAGFDPAQPFGGNQPQQPMGAPAQPAQPGQPQQPVQPNQPQQPYGQQPPQPTQPMGYNQGAYPPPPVPPAYAQKSSGKAIGALVCGILAILFSWLPLLGIILGIVAIVLASKAVKQFGRDGKATGGKICGIVGLVFSILGFIFWGFVSCAVLAAAPYADSGYSEIDEVINSDDSGAVATDELSAAEQQATDAGVAELEKLATQDESMVQYLAADLDEGFTEAMDMSHADLGIDPADLARWMLTDFSYTTDGVYVYEEDGEGTMYADLEMRDSYAFMLNFYDKVNALNSSEEIKTMTEDDAKARIGELYYEAMDETTDMTTYYASIDLVKEGDQWVVDQDSWEEELDYMFGIY
ncbi:MAG TPA: DUF4190 domain-containing protein [Slackia equolifaciens]|uniref:DUF4190 domain-containing protein n=1 Tax=Slackia equolifaciens TaxID=498718 RepID=A0A9D3A1T4_9ACTN|nr:DUF4190 domain-containing protein [Slackia equolifaciens]